jgi:hypothetical protein
VVVVISGIKKMIDNLSADQWLKQRYLHSCYGEKEETAAKDEDEDEEAKTALQQLTKDEGSRYSNA